MMTITTLASAIAKREGKKSITSIGDIREVLSIISTLECEYTCNGATDGPMSALQDQVNKKVAKKTKKTKTVSNAKAVKKKTKTTAKTSTKAAQFRKKAQTIRDNQASL